MKQTEHCALNQWELSDRIRMEDFNADNTQLDSLLSKLAFFVSRLTLAEVDRNKKTFLPGIAVNEQFLFPEYVTCPEGVTVQDGKAILEGPQTAALNCGLYGIFNPNYTQAMMWVEHSGGTVSATLNGISFQPVRSFASVLNNSIRTVQQEFFCSGLPSLRDLSVILDLDRETHEKMEVYNFSIILF